MDQIENIKGKVFRKPGKQTLIPGKSEKAKTEHDNIVREQPLSYERMQQLKFVDS